MDTTHPIEILIREHAGMLAGGPLTGLTLAAGLNQKAQLARLLASLDHPI